jgi:hypothetical protein
MVTMKTKLAVITLGALVLMANGANAQHRTGSATHVRSMSRIFGQARAFAPRETPLFQASGGSYSRPSNNNLNPDFQLGGER